jgi:hypothetical protein
MQFGSGYFRFVFILTIESHSDGSNDETSNCFVAKFVWPTQARSVPCSSLKPIHKNQQEEMKFTFDVSKCDCIFDEMSKNELHCHIIR